MSAGVVVARDQSGVARDGGRQQPSDAGRGRHQPGDAGRDRAIDAVRAIAIGGVVLGHWLVTGLVLTADGLAQSSPLRAMPWLAPASWLFQTLGLFFFAAGYAAARSRSSGPRGLAGLLRPLAGFVALWTVALIAAAVAGAPDRTLRTVAMLAISPLWFLLPFAVLRSLTGPLRWAVRRWGLVVALPAVAVLALSDAGVRLLPLTVVSAWLVPYVFGLALHERRLHRGGALLLTGAIGMAVLVLVFGYPASAVGVPGAGRSNLDPPSLFALALGTAQVGVALLSRSWLNRRPSPRPVRLLNTHALPIYLWHQSALVAVVGLAAVAAGGAVLGLHTTPDGPLWVTARMAWLPAFGVILIAACHLGSRRGYTMSDGSERERPKEVIAVRRDSDPPSHSRAVRPPS
ncbi:acyltransferase [Actinomycetes bacterium KLBMP 9797]